MDTKKFERTKVDPTEKIVIEQTDEATLEQELRQQTKDELLRRLNFEETDPDVIKLIKKVLKTKA